MSLLRVAIGLVLAAALAAFGWKCYVLGQQSIQLQWDKDRLERQEELTRQEHDFRVREQQLVAAKHETEIKYVELKKRFARDAAGADAELGRLRDLLASAPGAAPAAADSAPGPRVDAGPGLESKLLGSCAAALVRLAAAADGLEAQVVGLQLYIQQVLLTSK